MAAVVVTRLIQRQLGPPQQGVGHSQSGYAGANDGHLHAASPAPGQNVWIFIFVVDKVMLMEFLFDKIRFIAPFVLDKQKT
jgi:hypothetical protein